MLFKNWKNKTEVGRVIGELIHTNTLFMFYNSPEWRMVRAEVLREHHYECSRCRNKKPKEYTRATTVHHRKYLRLFPALALSKTYVSEGITKMNLEPLCDECHKKEHTSKSGAKFYNKERW